MKAGKIAFGADMCVEHMKKKEAKLLILSEDLSERTKEKFINLANDNCIDYFSFGTIEELSQSIGKTNKGIIAVLDEGFANKISQMVKNFKGANN